MKHVQLLVLCTLPIVATSSLANQVKFSPRADINYTTMEQEFKLVGGGGGKDDADLLMASAGVTMSYKRFIVDVDYKDTIKDDDGTERNELALSGGYVFPNVAVFGGYKMTENSFEYQGQSVDDTLEVDGFFAGASYYTPIGNRWVLNVTAAYSLTDAEYSDRDPVFGGKYDGDGDGFSFAVMGTMKLNEKMKLYVKLDAQAYTYDLDLLGQEIEADETYSRLSVGVKF